MQTKFLLEESQMLKYWYNLQADFPQPLPAVLHPVTQQPVGPSDLEPLFPLSLIEQEVTTERDFTPPGFHAGVLFARNEGIVPAPEANHAVKGAIDEALRCKLEGREEVILFNLCGHGLITRPSVAETGCPRRRRSVAGWRWGRPRHPVSGRRPQSDSRAVHRPPCLRVIWVKPASAVF